MTDFNSLLDMSAEDATPPKPLPSGEYTFRVKNYEFGESSQKHTPYVRYLLQPLSAGEDVDEELLAEVDDWQNKTKQVTFYLTENAIFMLRDFLENACGLEIAGRSFKELIPEAVGMEVIGTVSVETNAQTERSYNPDVSRLQPVE